MSIDISSSAMKLGIVRICHRYGKIAQRELCIRTRNSIVGFAYMNCLIHLHESMTILNLCYLFL